MSSCLSSSEPPLDADLDLFRYTSGKWIYNDTLRHAERYVHFDVLELKRRAAESVQRKAEDVMTLQKLAEGGFNRTFLITMRDGFQVVARIPYPVTIPKQLVIASEVATIDFLRSHGMPVPKIYGYSTVAENSVGTEYLFLEFMRGTNVGDAWYTMTEKQRLKLVSEIADLEARMFAIDLPASGSLYYARDLAPEFERIQLPGSVDGSPFCIGPDTTMGQWYGKRSSLSVKRGPYSRPEDALRAGAQKEHAYLRSFGRPLHPFQRIRREVYEYQKQSPAPHIANLENYLRIADYLVPKRDIRLSLPKIRHPDLQPNNIFVSDDFEITGLIDWQHCVILPLFLQSGIPKHFQNYGDNVSESLIKPQLPANFGSLSGSEQAENVELLRRRQLHYYYVVLTEKLNEVHYNALISDLGTLRRKLYHHSSDPWEGDNVTLKADLIQAVQHWAKLTADEGGQIPPCPIYYPEDEIKECLSLHAFHAEADEQLEQSRDVIGVGAEGWVPVDQYEAAKERSDKLKADALEEAESDLDRAQILEHWPFDSHDEDEYLD